MYKTILLVLALLISEEGDRKSLFTSPLDIPLTLSANFAELRPGHFHSGVDFKTSGVIGKKVFSIGDGYIYRISISPGGFGNALYIRHNNGYSSVYGHLDRFMPEIEKYATEVQYAKQSFSVNLFPDKDKFRVKKGQQIAFSGNSGSSMGPHLHFEIRRSSNENPLDPVKFFDIADNIKPVLKNLYIYSFPQESDKKGKSYSLSGSKGHYSIKGKDLIETGSEFGIGISNHDFLNNSWNKCGSRIIRMSVDDTVYYKHSLDEFSFSQTRYINSHIDYAEYIENKTYVQKTFVDPNNFLPIYDTLKNDGIISLKDNKIHRVKLEIIDYSDNKSTLEFLVRSGTALHKNNNNNKAGHPMKYNRENSFIRHDIRLLFPSDAFYEDLNFSYAKIPGEGSLLADIHTVHKNTVPVHKAFKLSVKAKTSDSLLLSKAGIVRISGKDTIFIGGEYKDGFFESYIRDFGNYSIGTDKSSPELYPYNFKSRDRIPGKDALKFYINDDISGIAEYSATIDGEWALLEWDPKNKMLSYFFRKASLKENSEHSFTIRASDQRNNISEFKGSFYW